MSLQVAYGRSNSSAAYMSDDQEQQLHMESVWGGSMSSQVTYGYANET